MLNSTLLRKYFIDAIINNDLATINHLTLDNTTIPFFIKHNKEFVDIAYANKQLKSVETLITNGAVFNIKSLFLINEFSCNQISHIDNIKPYISSIQYEAATNLVKSYACNNQIDKVTVKSDYTCINRILYMSDHTVTNTNYSTINKYHSNLNNNLTPLGLEAINGLIGVSYNITSPFIIIPIGTRTFFDAANIEKPHGTSLIYIPVNNMDKLEYSFTMHEFIHYLLNALPEFKGTAYFDEISRKNYEKSAKETLLNLFSLFNKTVPNRQEVINNDKFQVESVVEALINHTDINLFTHLSNPDNDIRTEILMNKYVDSSAMPALNKKTLLGNFLKSYMQKNNFSQEEGYVLARIGEFLKRPSHEFSKELIVRLLELEIYGINSKTLEIFNPLREYWTKYISPKIHEVIKLLPVSFCEELEPYDVILPEQHNITTIGNTIIIEHNEL